MNYLKKCEHKNIKYFEKTDKVVCLNCGQDFYKEVNYFVFPTIPYNPPSLLPNYPIYPTITWTKVADNSN